MRRTVSENAVVFKHEQFSHAHLASGRAVVILEHVYYGLPQEFYIFIGKLSRLLRQSRGYISLRAIKAVRDDTLFTHFRVARFRSVLGSPGLSRYSYILDKNR